MNLSHQCALVTKQADGVPGFIKQSITNRQREVILPLYSALLRPHLVCWVHFRSPPVPEKHGLAGDSTTEGQQDDAGSGASLL